VEQPFLWNGAFGYEYIPFTGLYHIGARVRPPNRTVAAARPHRCGKWASECVSVLWEWSR